MLAWADCGRPTYSAAPNRTANVATRFPGPRSRARQPRYHARTPGRSSSSGMARWEIMKVLQAIRAFPGHNRTFTVALLLAAAVRAVTMLAFRPAIWFGGDSASYVAVALRGQPDISRVSGYGLFLRILRPFHSFMLVVAVQHCSACSWGSRSTWYCASASGCRRGEPRWPRCRCSSTPTRSSSNTRFCPTQPSSSSSWRPSSSRFGGAGIAPPGPTSPPACCSRSPPRSGPSGCRCWPCTSAICCFAGSAGRSSA